MQKQYDMQNIFQKKKSNKTTENIQNSTELTLYKEPGILRKFFDFVKGIFKKNKK